MEEVQRFIVVISFCNFIGVVFFGFGTTICIVLQVLHALMLLLMLIGIKMTRPTLLLPNLVFKGCFSSTLLFLALQGAEQSTLPKPILLWFSVSAFLCIFEMHYMLATAFTLAEVLREKANGPPSYKEVKVEDGELPSYESAIKAIREGTVKVPVHKARTITSPLHALDEPKMPQLFGAASPI